MRTITRRSLLGSVALAMAGFSVAHAAVGPAPAVSVSPLVLSVGAAGDGVTNDTIALNKALTVISTTMPGAAMDLGSRTWVVDGVVLKANAGIKGDGKGKARLLRSPNATAGSVVNASSVTGIYLADFTIDGNKANNTVSAYGLLFNGCGSLKAHRVESINAKGLGGVAVSGLTDTQTNGNSSLFSEISASGNDTVGMLVQGSSWRLKILDSEFNSNTGSGLSLTNTFPPVDRTNLNLEVSRCQAQGNGSTGIGAQGFIIGVNGSSPVFGVGTEPFTDVLMADNHCLYNAGYGMVAQVRNGLIRNNTCSFNGGTGSFFAGLLANAEYTLFDGNLCENNEFYGIDAGGAFHCDIRNNRTGFNGFQSSSGSGVGLNFGGSRSQRLRLIAATATARAQAARSSSATYTRGRAPASLSHGSRRTLRSGIIWQSARTQIRSGSS